VILQQRNSQLESQVKQLTSQVTQLKSNESLLNKENRELKQQKTTVQDKHNQVCLHIKHIELLMYVPVLSVGYFII